MKLAAGLVIFRRIVSTSNNFIEYLLLQTSYGEHHWTPPKGHLDEGEDDLTAAIRETTEEAGLKLNEDYEIIDKNFKIEVNYLVNSKPKRVTYWLAEFKEHCRNPITLSDEHTDFKWLNLEQAIEIVKYKEMIDVLNQSNNFILNKINIKC